MDDLQILIDLHKHNQRLGPGSDEHTLQALALSGLMGRRDLRVADIGCGTGASALVLAEHLDASVCGVDLFDAFLDELKARAVQRGVAERVETLTASMEELPFEAESLDAIWSEGAICSMGFERGVREWRRLLKPGGILAVSEITWLSAVRPAEVQEHWEREYPEIGTAAEKFAVLEKQGFSPIGYFTLPASCWREGYFGPLQQRFDELLQAHSYSEAAQTCVAAQRDEIALYEAYQDYFSYGFYIARKV